MLIWSLHDLLFCDYKFEDSFLFLDLFVVIFIC